MAERKTDAETNRDSADHEDGSAYARSGGDADDNCADVFTLTVGLAPNMCKSSASKRSYDMHMPAQLARVPQSEPPSTWSPAKSHHSNSTSGSFTSAHAPCDAVAVVPAN